MQAFQRAHNLLFPVIKTRLGWHFFTLLSLLDELVNRKASQAWPLQGMVLCFYIIWTALVSITNFVFHNWNTVDHKPLLAAHDRQEPFLVLNSKLSGLYSDLVVWVYVCPSKATGFKLASIGFTGSTLKFTSVYSTTDCSSSSKF